MKKLKEILKYAKDLREQNSENTAYWHYFRLLDKIEESIDEKEDLNNNMEIVKYISMREYPERLKGGMTTHQPVVGVQLKYDDGKQSFIVSCDKFSSPKENKDKCLEIIKAYLLQNEELKND